MKCKQIYMKNVQRVKEQTVNLDYPSIVLLGANRTGKSTLLNAIALALTGEGAREKGTIYDFATRGTKEDSVVSLDVVVNNVNYRITRQFSRSKKKSTANVYVMDQEWNQLEAIASQKIGEINDFINKNIINFDVFSSILYANQFKIKSLIEIDPAKRKDLLMNMLEFSHLSKISEFYKSKAAPLEKQMFASISKLDILRERLTRKPEVESDLNLYSKEIKQLEKELARIDADLVNYSAKLEKLGEKSQKAKSLESDVANCKKDLDLATKLYESVLKTREEHQKNLSLKDQLKVMTDKNSEIHSQFDEKKLIETELVKNYEDIRLNVITLEKSISILDSSIDSIKKQLEHLAGVPKFENAGCFKGKKLKYEECPFILFVKDEVLKQDELTSSLSGKGKKLAELQSELSQYGELQSNVGTQLVNVRKELETLQKSFLDREISSLSYKVELAQTALSNTEADLVQKETDLKAKQTLFDSAKKTHEKFVEKVGNVIKEIDAINRVLKPKSDRKTEINSMLREKYQILGSNKNELKLIEEAEEDISLISSGADKLKEYIEKCSLLSATFGKTGIQPVLIDMARPEIEDIANRFFEKIGETMSVALKTQRETASKTKEEGLWIYLYDENGFEDIYESYCGAERSFVNAVLYMTFLTYLSRKGKEPIFLVDEGFDWFDETNKIKIMQLIAEMNQACDQVIAVTHSPTVATLFSHTINVANVKGETVYE